MSDFVVELQKEVLAVEVSQPAPLQVDFPAHVTIINNESPGADIETITEEFEAASQININRALVLLPDGRVAHADKDNQAHNLDVIGVSKTSGATGQLVTVVKYGKLTGASFGAISENFFLGNNGQLTSVAPTEGNWLYIGIQEAASEFFVNIGESIEI